MRRAPTRLSSAATVPPAARLRQGGLPGLVVDGLIATAVFSYNLPVQGLFLAYGPSWWLFLVPVGFCAPFVARRRHPTAVFAVIIATAYAQLLLSMGLLVADVMILLGLYTVACLRGWVASTLCLLASVVWVLLATVPDLGGNDLTIGDVALFVLLVVVAWILGRFSRIRLDYIEALELRAVQLRREQETLSEMAAAQERTRIAREIHDVVSHGLSAVVLLSDGAARAIRTDPQTAEEAVLKVRDTSRSAMSEMRSMLRVLRTDHPAEHEPQPGMADLQELFWQSQEAGVPVRFHQEGSADVVPEAIQLVIYRVIQESLTNARKHGGADLTFVAVDVICSPHQVEVRVVDDGVGVAPNAGSGVGLLGMRERVSAHGGQVQMTSTRDGFRVVAVLPIGGRE